MAMRITELVYTELLNSIESAPPEHGGLLGGESGIVDRMILDLGTVNNDCNMYRPDARKLNAVLREWAAEGIALYGIFHTHPNAHGFERLSGADMVYIRKIMQCTGMKELYFPIVIPKVKVVPYAARQQSGCISIEKAELVIL
ncbi:Mov34/MPN/PAD-1 family protein [uncultured Gemmiger sp.]|mgnify:CR=1 FL=1|uniref:Mov34/MPN/PAD-1 family protein n=1 Tax=uncultured Gemmiger sp. TaxID=1623490 RepID=UPI0025F32749|nr:Mov34/MPN/PAD-1 family protein [uncultured Gemmiger sp.]